MSITVYHHHAPAVARATQALPPWAARWLPGLVLVGALGGLAVAWPASRGWIGHAVVASLYSSAQALLALAVFVGLVWLAYRALHAILLRLHPDYDRVLPLLAAFLLGVLAVNSLPIVVYIDALRDAGWPPLAVTVGALLMANAMLYFFFNRFFHMLWRELHKLYARSAAYKGDTAIGYVGERVRWELLNILKPVYLYLFSFTLFTDYLLELDRVSADGDGVEMPMGIVGLLFRTISAEGWTAEVWVYLAVLWAVLWPQRALLDRLARRWEQSHHV